VVVLALGLTILFSLIYNIGTDFLTREYALNGSHCLSNRTNPHFIHVPFAQEQKFLSGLWNHLHPLFEDHKPDPPHMDTPKHGGFPNQENLGGFFNLTDQEAEHTREIHADLLRGLPSYPAGRFSGRGVVVLAGARYSEFAATTVGMLRETGSRLPVEVWSKDHSEENDEWCNELQQEGMACRRLADYMDMNDLKHPYQWKVFTLLYSTFEEILFLDADSIPVKNPDFVFDSQVYKENGVILWPDYWKHTGSPWLPYLIGINETKSSDMIVPEMSVESGQIYWNKKSHWKVRRPPPVYS
jgi:alpha 1,2-mannosyltransferase